MSVRPITRIPQVAPLLAGHFVEGPGYTNWRPRGTEDYLLMLTLDGGGRVDTATGPIITSIGDAILIRPHTRHDYRTAPPVGRWELLWAHFLPRPHWQEWLRWPEPGAGVGRIALPEGETRERVTSALHMMVDWTRSGRERRTDFAMNALETALLWCDTANPEAGRAKLDPRVRRAMEYLLENLRSPVSLEAVADKVGLSSSRLAHLFKEQTGETPREFLERERILRAGQLLTLTGRTVAAVAEEVGFENPFYFTLRFKKRTGFSPRAWRDRGGANG